jgi:hypothetical protein
MNILTALIKLWKNVMSLETSTIFNPSESLIRTLKRTNFEVGATVIFHSHFLFILIMGGGVHTGYTWHCGHFWPIVPAPGDCEEGEVGGMNGFGGGNRSTRRKPALTPLCPPQIPRARPGPLRWEASG